MRKPVRIYFVGAHSTGKTTLARWVRDHYDLPMISEVARGVLAEMEERLDQIRSNLDVVDRYQTQVFERQIAAEADHQGAFVSDRAFCNLAYAAHHSTVLADLARDRRLADYMASVREGIVFFLRPHAELLSHDGVRAGVAWEEVVRIDGMVKFMLEMFAVPYIPVESLAMQERVRLIERVLSLAGVDRAHDVQAPMESVPARRATLRPTRRDGNGEGSGLRNSETASL
ncbi:MAG: AAA family ATPase [Planctomycetes bacterium]|nr:AAA family ATPase [Planctomycetota bacterium]